MRPASSTTTDFSGAWSRSDAAAARPLKPAPTTAKSASCGRDRRAGVKSIAHGGWPQRSSLACGEDIGQRPRFRVERLESKTRRPKQHWPVALKDPSFRRDLEQRLGPVFE